MSMSAKSKGRLKKSCNQSKVSHKRRRQRWAVMGCKKAPTPTDVAFPFDRLPNECKVKILAYLTDREKCTAALVCTSWTQLVRTPCLWTRADFVGLPFCRRGGDQFLMRSPAVECKVLKERVRDFVFHLVSRRALVRELLFEFDLHDGEEVWLKLLVYLLQGAPSHELHSVRCDWTHTRHIPWFLSGAAVDAKESRVASFRKFLAALLDTSPGIRSFAMPFDWSPASLALLCRFRDLSTLELSKYWVFHGLPQRLLDRLLRELPNLRRFKLEVAVPFRDGDAYPQYTMASETLEELDISACSGFFLWSVTLPSLRHFWDSRTAWSGPILPRKALRIQCLYRVLRNGAPRLRFFNSCPLSAGWRDVCPADLEEALRATCYCEHHKNSPLIF